jgi:hypothetical protein
LEVCGNPDFVCSPAEGHNHPHYQNYARYELLDAVGQALVVGHKQGFCLMDSACPAPVFSCDSQGVSAGCSDFYGPTLGCQYLDITGVPSGDYRIRVTLDPFNRVPELSESNNVAIVPVTIVRPSGSAPTRTPTPQQTPTPARTPTATRTVTRTRTPAPTATSGGAGACANATIIPAGGGTFSGTTAGASSLTGSCAQTEPAPERVFQWTPTVSGVATIQTCSSTATTFDTVIHVRSSSCATGAEIACNDDTSGCGTSETNGASRGSRVTPTVTAGVTYFIVVDGYIGKSGAFTLSVVAPSGPAPTPTRTVTPASTATPTPARTATPTRTGATTPTATPGATACGAASVLPAAGGVFTGTTSGGSTLRGSCGVTSNSPETVFEWTPAGSGTATFETCGSDYDTVLYVRSGACTTGTELTCNDDTTGCGTNEPSSFHGSRVRSTVTAGTTYVIVVDGFNGRGGRFQLRVSPP